MWQALLAAAVAGSTGIVAKHLFKATPDPTTLATEKPTIIHDHEEDEDESQGIQFLGSSGHLGLSHASAYVCEDGIFRFSSMEVNGGRVGSKKLSKKSRVLGRQLKKGVGFERSDGLEQRRSVRRFGVCLKRRKTSKKVAGKNETYSSSSSNDTSLFGWGLGVGIMYMMSAGRVEFSKLNTAMSETAKVVEQLKTEIHKRKFSPNLEVAGGACEVISNHNDSHPDLNKSSRIEQLGPNDINNFNPMIIDGECGSSALTEEPEPGVQEMDQLEKELEFELQKLPWCTVEASDFEDSIDLVETEISAQLFPAEQERQDSGILPVELDQKLCHLLIERQENPIEELESELHVAQSKLHEKEAELQALKDCVKRLTQFSISSLSDDETETEAEQEQTLDWNHKKVGSESKEPGVGMKRPLDSNIVKYNIIS
ncbi:uncharacterized protein LOC133831041 [Humulus lupulus]|uniref:uncharacterized protein LOC133831041 n=1 Tax=Humulus lupulus TaxID=3486 RepID=UPI002B409A8D|nr:uncharacterized protein LOC133831041 [Humulus lupulus]XP_062117186.1 uncharacterized protein LOC133831041 [Humulus lupulus]XP_062117187.1 uncharacterized protein LOC133831041 [Humulus lupulus]